MPKLSPVLGFVGVLCVVALASGQNETCKWFKRNHFELGHRTDGERFALKDKKLYKERVPSEKVELLESFTVPAGMVITRIQAINERDDGIKGGCGFLVSGGPGNNYVTIKFVSFVGLPIKFKLIIFAQPKKQ